MKGGTVDAGSGIGTVVDSGIGTDGGNEFGTGVIGNSGIGTDGGNEFGTGVIGDKVGAVDGSINGKGRRRQWNWNGRRQ